MAEMVYRVVNTETVDRVEQIALTQVNAARAMDVSPMTIRRWEAKGLITGRRIEGIKLYLVDDLKRLVSGPAAEGRAASER